VSEGYYHHVGSHSNVLHLIGSPAGGLRWDEQDKAVVTELWNSGAEEPLSHELLREAKTLASTSPRSALLTLATALEVGAKTYISQVAPQTAWLIQNLPSPPVFRLFRNYLPALHAEIGRTDIDWWDKLKPQFVECQRLFEDRNSLTHAGHAEVTADEISDYLKTASTLLYALDILQGHEWAKERIGYKVPTELGWRAPRS
jgi:hypothetical protein